MTVMPRPSILSVEPYVGGESKIPGVNRIVKLSSNEGAFGPPPSAIAAIAGLAADAHRYPDGGAKALREAIGGGAAIIPSSAKMGGPGSALDLPLGHKDDVWSRGHFDAITVSLGDGPRPDEILVVIGLADGGRLLHRIGEGAPR